MCGRFIQSSRADRYARLFGTRPTPEPAAGLPPRYNVAPSQPVLIARETVPGRRELALVRWGLVPSWSKGIDSRYSMINARAETVHEKPAYRGPFRYRRCLVPAEGFYEWKADGRKKVPYCLFREDGEILAMAGLWDLWMGPNGEEMESCTIIVTAANGPAASVHERMPVILPPDRWGQWLDPIQQLAGPARTVLDAGNTPALSLHRVSTRVNSPANDGPDLAQAIDENG